MKPLRLSRRELFALTGVTTGSVLTARRFPDGSLRRAKKRTTKLAQYRSRPDLRPPIVTITGDPAVLKDPPSNDYIFATPGGPIIFDVHGDPVWYRPVPHYSTNLRLQQYQGQPVLTWWQGKTATYGVGNAGECLVLDTSYREITRVNGANGLVPDLHEFVIAPDGTAYVTAYQVVTADLSAIGGPARASTLEAWIQGFDLASGALVFQWRSSDYIDLTETHKTYSASSKAPFTPVHLNSIDPLPDGNLLVSARHTWTIYKVDRGTGKILWRLGGKHSDFTLGPGVHFAWQHDAEWHSGNVLTMFDNESPPPEAKQSRGLVLHVTETKMVVGLRHAYEYPGEELLVGAQGSVQLLPSGDVFMGWGLQPHFTQYRHDGKAVLKGSFAEYKSYRAFRVRWTGTPTGAPAIAAERVGGDGVHVYASWNGATEVETWSVVGGSSRGALSELGRATRSGFETTIAVSAPANVRFVAARALDSDGTALATSPVTGI